MCGCCEREAGTEEEYDPITQTALADSCSFFKTLIRHCLLYEALPDSPDRVAHAGRSHWYFAVHTFSSWVSPVQLSSLARQTRELWPAGPRPLRPRVPHTRCCSWLRRGHSCGLWNRKEYRPQHWAPHRLWRGVRGIVSLNPSLLLLSWRFEPAWPSPHGTLRVLGPVLGGGRDGVHWPLLWSRNHGVGRPVGGRSWAAGGHADTSLLVGSRASPVLLGPGPARAPPGIWWPQSWGVLMRRAWAPARFLLGSGGLSGHSLGSHAASFVPTTCQKPLQIQGEGTSAI